MTTKAELEKEITELKRLNAALLESLTTCGTAIKSTAEIVADSTVALGRMLKAPKVKQQQTVAKWKPYQEQFQELINSGTKASTARNIIGNRIEKDTSTKPSRTTLTRQLISK